MQMLPTVVSGMSPVWAAKWESWSLRASSKMFSNQLSSHWTQNNFLKSKVRRGRKMAPPPKYSLTQLPGPLPVLTKAADTGKMGGRPQKPLHQGPASATVLPFSLPPLPLESRALHPQRHRRWEGEMVRECGLEGGPCHGIDGGQYSQKITRARILNPPPTALVGERHKSSLADSKASKAGGFWRSTCCHCSSALSLGPPSSVCRP